MRGYKGYEAVFAVLSEIKSHWFRGMSFGDGLEVVKSNLRYSLRLYGTYG
jgi:hypothetical protein